MTNQVLTIVSQSNSESVVNHALIRATTDAGTATAETFALGFVPRRVKVVNLTGLIIDEWFEGMAAASSVHTVGSTGVVTLETTHGVTVNPQGNALGGASITLDATTMAASSTFAIEAVG